MDLTYQGFEDRYIVRAQTLCCYSAKPQHAYLLCQRAYSICNEKGITDDRDVKLRLAEIYHSEYALVCPNPVEGLVARIYPAWQKADENDFISIEEYLHKIGGIISQFPLLKRIVITLYSVGRNYESLAYLLNETFAEIPSQLPTNTDFDAIVNVLDTIKKTILKRIANQDKNALWINKIIDQPLNINTVAGTWATIKQLLSKPSYERFSRKNNPYTDLHCKLRDWWNDGKKEIWRHYQPEDFLTDK